MLAVVGNLSIDRINGAPPRIGGGPYHAARALRLLAARGEVVARCGDGDRRFLGPRIAALGVPLHLLHGDTTTSFTFENARPVKFTGLMARYTLNPKISILGLVANGWDQVADNNSGKTAGLKVQLFPTSGLAVAAGALYGPEQDSTNGSQRTLLTGDATWQPVPRLILQAEAHHGSQTGVKWTGVVGQGFLRVGRSTGLTVRGEVLDDPNGARTGTAQKLSSVTISPWYFYREAQEGVFSNVEFTNFHLPAFSIRPALRIDHSDQPVFEKKDGSLVRSNLTALVELVYLF